VVIVVGVATLTAVRCGRNPLSDWMSTTVLLSTWIRCLCHRQRAVYLQLRGDIAWSAQSMAGRVSRFLKRTLTTVLSASSILLRLAYERNRVLAA
jgi:hypothetical protein